MNGSTEYERAMCFLEIGYNCVKVAKCKPKTHRLCPWLCLGTFQKSDDFVLL